MKQIRVLQLGNPSGLYGAEHWILALMRNLPADRVDLWVGAIKDSPYQQVEICQEAMEIGIKTKIFEGFGKINFHAVKLVRQFIQDNRIDILHTHGYKTDLLGVLATIATSCRLVSTPHGWTKKPDFKLFCYEIINRLFFLFCDAVVPLSQAMIEPLRYIPGLTRKLFLIQNGVDIIEIESIDTVHEEMKHWKEEGAFIAGYIGRLIYGKGIETLLSSLAMSGMEDWRLAIIGDGEQGEEFKVLTKSLGISDRVIFFGFRSDRLNFLKGFDVFVLPSESEGIPRCLMEAMAARVPVVASDIPGCRYLVDHRRTGLLFQTNNASELAQALIYLVAEPHLAHSLVNAAYDHVNTYYSASRMAKEYVQLYERLMTGSVFQEG